MSVNEKARALAEAIKQTPEFAEMKQARSVIEKNKSLKSQVDEFNRKQKELYESKMPAKEAENRIAELNRKFGELAKAPEVDKFLKASNKFNSMVSQAFKVVNDSIDSGFRY